MRVGRVESIVPFRDAMLADLEAAESIEDVKKVVATFISTVGTFVTGFNERTGESVLGQLALGGGGSVFFSDVDRYGHRLTPPTLVEDTGPTEDRKSGAVEKREAAAKAARVAVGRSE